VIRTTSTGSCTPSAGVGIAFLGDKLFGHRGNVVGVSLVVGLCVFAIVGAVSAGRRVWYAVAARRRYRDSNDQLDSRSRELIAVARAGHATLAIQFGVGLASALIVLLLWW
jgi:hypothetical protein